MTAPPHWQIKPELSAGVIGSVNFGAPPNKFNGKLSLEAAVASLGLKQSADLAFVQTQVLDDTYASSYKLEYEWEVAAGADLENCSKL